MAWLSVKEMGDKMSSERNGRVRIATRVFVVVSDTPTTTVEAERARAGGKRIPLYAEGYPGDQGRKVKLIRANPSQDAESNRTVFIVEVTYSSETEGLPDRPLNPLLRPPDITWDFDDEKEAYFEDRSSPPRRTVTSTGEPFEEFLERESGSLVCTYTKNIEPTAYDPIVAVDYKDAVNTDSFQLEGKTVREGRAKLKAWTAGSVQEENGVRFRPSRWVLQLRRTWDHLVEDRSRNEIDVTNVGNVKTIVKGTPPEPVNWPWPLDGRGHALANVSDQPFVWLFVPYFKLPFSRFNFS